MTYHPEMLYDFYIHHSPKDVEWVDGVLRVALTGASLLSSLEYRPGHLRGLEAVRAVQQSKYTLLIISPNLVEEEYADFVEGVAFHLGVSERRGRLIPVRISESGHRTPSDHLVALDFTDRAAWEAGIGQLRRMASLPSQVQEEEISCPFPGILSYSLQERDYYHGRTDDSERILGLLCHHDRVLIAGASGSGKSSLIEAGVMPALQHPPANVPNFDIRSLHLAVSPVEQVASALRQERAEPVLSQQAGRRRRLLWIDAFEELFALSDKQEQEQAIQLLVEASATGRAVLLMAIRTDFLDRFWQTRLGQELAPKEIMLLKPLNKTGLRAAICEPCRMKGVQVDPVLVERLIADATSASDSAHGNLPLLQVTLRSLWAGRVLRFLPLDAYEALQRFGDGRQSGMAVAVERMADGIYGKLSPEERELARRILLELVHLAERDTRQRRLLERLRQSSQKPELFEKTIAHLVAGRLLVVDGDGAEPRFVEIAHEILLTGWPLLRTWIEQWRMALLQKQLLEAQALRWDARGRSHRSLLNEEDLLLAEALLQREGTTLGFAPDLQALVAQSREVLDRRRALAARRRIWFTLLLAMLGGISGVGLHAWTQRTQAQRIARAVQLGAHATSLVAEPLRGDEETALIKSILAVSTFVTRGQRPPWPALEGIMRATAALELRFPLRGAPDHPLSSVAVSPRGNTIFTGGDAGVVIWEREEGSWRSRPFAGPRAVFSMAHSPTESLLATAEGNEGEIRLWSTADRRLVRTLRGHQDRVWSCRFSQDGQILVTASADKTAGVWNVGTGQRLWVLPHPQSVYGADISRDRTLVATAGEDGEVRIWDASAGSKLREFTAHQGAVADVMFAPDDGQLLATAGYDRVGRLWDAQTGSRVHDVMGGHGERLWRLSFALRGEAILTLDLAGEGRQWSRTGRPLRVFPAHQGATGGVLALPGEALAAVVDGHGDTWLWQLRTRTSPTEGVCPVPAGWQREASQAGMGRGRLLARSTANHRALWVDRDLVMRIVNDDTGEELIRWRAPSHVVAGTFAEEAGLVITVDGESGVWLWDPELGKALVRFRDDPEALPQDAQICFSPRDEQILLTKDGRILRHYLIAPSHWLRRACRVLLQLPADPGEAQAAARGRMEAVQICPQG